MNLKLAALAALILCLDPAWAQQQGQIDGLWAARMSFGPEVHGSLLIERQGGRLVADIAGRRADARIENGEVRFELANNMGAFRGRFAGQSAIHGHWIQPRTVASGANYASPVTLTRERAGRWRGEVTPMQDAMSMFMPIRTDESGILRAYLRNPERNNGVFQRIDRIERQGDHLRIISRFRGRGEEEVLAEGEYVRDGDLIRLHWPQYNVSVDFRRANAQDERAFYPRGREAPLYSYTPPPALDDGWRVGMLEQVGIDRAQIMAFADLLTHEPMAELGTVQIHGVVIARHGRLVFEEYFHGYDRSTPHDTRSAAKSVTAIMLGAAIQNGAPFSPQSLVVDSVDPALLPATIDPRLRAMRLENLLTMAPGFDCDDDNDSSPGNENAMQEQQTEPNWWRFSLAVPMARNPGERAIYCSMNPNLTGAVLSHGTGRWIADQFAEQVARPMQMQLYHLNLTPTGEPYLGGGFQLELRDFLKIGQLVLNDGEWNGRRIVPRQYMAQMTAPLIELGTQRYGYFWWSMEMPYQGRRLRAVYAGGNGGQIVMVFPDLDLVIGFVGGNYADRVAFTSQQVYIPQHILPAVR